MADETIETKKNPKSLIIGILFCDKDYTYIEDLVNSIETKISNIDYKIVLVDNRVEYYSDTSLDDIFNKDLNVYRIDNKGNNCRQLASRKQIINYADEEGYDYIWFVDADDSVEAVDFDKDKIRLESDIIVFSESEWRVYTYKIHFPPNYPIRKRIGKSSQIAALWMCFISTSLLVSVRDKYLGDININPSTATKVSIKEDTFLIYCCLSLCNVIQFNETVIYSYNRIASTAVIIDFTGKINNYEIYIAGFDFIARKSLEYFNNDLGIFDAFILRLVSTSNDTIVDDEGNSIKYNGQETTYKKRVMELANIDLIHFEYVAKAFNAYIENNVFKTKDQYISTKKVIEDYFNNKYILYKNYVAKALTKAGFKYTSSTKAAKNITVTNSYILIPITTQYKNTTIDSITATTNVHNIVSSESSFITTCKTKAVTVPYKISANTISYTTSYTTVYKLSATNTSYTASTNADSIKILKISKSSNVIVPTKTIVSITNGYTYIISNKATDVYALMAYTSSVRYKNVTTNATNPVYTALITTTTNANIIVPNGSTLTVSKNNIIIKVPTGLNISVNPLPPETYSLNPYIKRVTYYQYGRLITTTDELIEPELSKEYLDSQVFLKTDEQIQDEELLGSKLTALKEYIDKYLFESALAKLRNRKETQAKSDTKDASELESISKGLDTNETYIKAEQDKLAIIYNGEFTETGLLKAKGIVHIENIGTKVADIYYTLEKRLNGLLSEIESIRAI